MRWRLVVAATTKLSEDTGVNSRHTAMALLGLVACTAIAAQPEQPFEVPPALNPHNVPASYDPYRFAADKASSSQFV